MVVWTILGYVACVVVGFIAGALVFRNNPVKGEALVDRLESDLAEARAKIEELKDKLSNL